MALGAQPIVKSNTGINFADTLEVFKKKFTQEKLHVNVNF